MKRTDIRTLIDSMRLLARDIQSEDGVANMAIREAADRMDDMLCCILARIPMQCRKEKRYDPHLCGDCSHAGLCQCLGGYDDGK